MAFTGLTDFRHMPPPEPDYMIYSADDDMTDGLWGRYAKAVSSKETMALVIPSDIFAPPVLTVWKDNAQQPPVRINECVRSETDAHDWFSHHRDPVRMFNHESDKHRKKEYITGEGVRVSPLDLDKTDIEHNLKIAVGDKKERRLFGYHKGRGSVIIFSLENHPKDGETPIYHGHRLQNDDPHQIHRLPPSPIRKLELFHSVKLL